MSAAVLHFRDEFLNPTETFIARWIAALEAAGLYRPHILYRTFKGEANLPAGRTLQMEGGAPGDGLIQTFGGAGALAVKALRRTGAFAPRLRPSPACLEWIRGVRPVLLHAHFGDGGYAMLETARILRLPLVVTFYGYDISILPKRRVWRKWYAELFREARLCLAEGGAMIRALREAGCPAEKARLVRNPAETASFNFRERTWRDARREPVNLLLVGRFVEKKGIVYALRAMARLRADFPALRLGIVGDGPLRGEIEGEIARLDLGGAVRLHGALPYPATKAMMEESDILLAPSVVAANGDSEGGAPNTLLDAQACGMPVVSTTHCDIPEFVAPGRSALLAPERDDAALADRIRELLDENTPHDWAAMGRAGREHVRAEFDTAAVLEKIHGIYREVLGGGSAS